MRNSFDNIVDAGLKAISSDSNLMPLPIRGIPNGSTYSFMGDEHGKITLPMNSKKNLSLGDMIFIQPAHCDPTVNLYNKCLVINKNNISQTWIIEARGYG